MACSEELDLLDHPRASCPCIVLDNQVVKLTFARGAALKDPRGLFNSCLAGNTRRAIDIREGEVLDAEAFKPLIQAAIAQNLRLNAPKSQGRGRM